MKGDRAASFGSFDTVSHKKRERSETRTADEAQRRKRYEESLTISASVAQNDNSSDCSPQPVVPCNIQPPPVIDLTPRKHRRQTQAGTTAFIPHNIASNPNLVSLATWLKMTPAQQSAYTAAFIAEVGGDASKVAASYATMDRSRRKVAADVASKQ